MDLLSIIKSGIVAVSVSLVSLFGYTTPVQSPVLGASQSTPDVRALFSTTLASRISATDTSMTLTSATDKDGNVLASSTYGFVIDEGTSVEEFVLADCTGTTCTNMTRGLSVYTGTTTVPSLRFEHRRGASVKITDAPSLLFAINVLKGRQNIENPLRYDNIATTTLALNENNLASVAYANSLSFGAVAQASETAAGFSELATGVQAASSTSVGETGARLVIPASLATSTYNSATAPLKVVVTGNDGKIDNNFISTSTGLFTNLTLSGVTTAAGVTNIASSSIITYTSSTTPTTTWTKPSNLKYVVVECQGGGGGGGTETSSNDAESGGGAGGYSKTILPASVLGSTESVSVGAGGGAEQDGGVSFFGSHIICNGGAFGEASAGTGGTATGGLINIQGQPGAPRRNVSGGGANGGDGGNSMFGFGGRGALEITTASANNGGSATGYGAGGGGGARGSSGTGTGGSGTVGFVIVTQYFY